MSSAISLRALSRITFEASLTGARDLKPITLIVSVHIEVADPGTRLICDPCEPRDVLVFHLFCLETCSPHDPSLRLAVGVDTALLTTTSLTITAGIDGYGEAFCIFIAKEQPLKK